MSRYYRYYVISSISHELSLDRHVQEVRLEIYFMLSLVRVKTPLVLYGVVKEAIYRTWSSGENGERRNSINMSKGNDTDSLKRGRE